MLKLTLSPAAHNICSRLLKLGHKECKSHMFPECRVEPLQEGDLIRLKRLCCLRQQTRSNHKNIQQTCQATTLIKATMGPVRSSPLNNLGAMEVLRQICMVHLQALSSPARQCHTQWRTQECHATTDLKWDIMATSSSRPHHQVHPSRRPPQTRDQMERTCSSSIFPIISRIWICINFFTSMGISSVSVSW